MAKQKRIDIKCTGSAVLALDKIKDFQGNLKRRTETHWQQIATSIEKYGFSFPFFIWKSGKTNYCLDGHGRLGALQRMVADGWEVPPLPVVFVQARDRAEAKQKLLRMNSQYGEFDIAGLQDFIADIEVDMEALALPIGKQIKKIDGVVDAQKEWQDMPEYMPVTSGALAYQTVQVHFLDEAAVALFNKQTGQKITIDTKYLHFPVDQSADLKSVVYE